MKSFFIGNIEIKTPVIQGGMGVGISLSGLASAVANEGLFVSLMAKRLVIS